MPDKKSKSEVNYRESDGPRYCGNCSMFRLTHGKYDGDCSLVRSEPGGIYKYDVCDKWEAEKEDT